MALVRSILFADGENLTFRYQALVNEGRVPKVGVRHSKDTYVWQPDIGRPIIDTDILRINYYTSMCGDDVALARVQSELAGISYWAGGDLYGKCQLFPRVYKKAKQSTKSRLVDINITIDVMRHACSEAIDVVYLFSGDGDFLSLVKEVARAGKKVCLADFSSGLDQRLAASVDRFVLLDDLYFEPPNLPETAGADAGLPPAA